MTLPYGTLAPLQCRQPKAELIPVSVDVSEVSAVVTGTGGLVEGKYAMTVFKNGTGDLTFTLNRASRRKPVFLGMPVPLTTVDVRFSITELAVGAFRIVSEVGGTDTDVDYHFSLLNFQDDKQR